MADIGAIGAEAALSFMVSGGLVYEIVAAACSSPQTTEINAGKRADTLMKWVWLGLGQAAVFVGTAAFIANKTGKGDVNAIVLGGFVAGGMMLLSYEHAKRAGLANGGEGTEQY